MKNCALITGCTGGLGRAYSFECASRGYDLVLSATKQERIELLAKDIKEKHPQINIFCKSADLSIEASRLELIKFLKDNGAKINILINNAGYIFEKTFIKSNDEDILKSIRVNVEGTVDITQKVLKNRDESKRFYVLFVSSMASLYPMPQMATYAATKAFLTSFSIAIRDEFRCQNVYVSSVCPGSMATNDAMKASIKSQGFGGKLSLETTEKVARMSINAMLKNKAMCVPGWFNKFLHFISKISPRTTQAGFAGKRWRKCEAKRGESD